MVHGNAAADDLRDELLNLIGEVRVDSEHERLSRLRVFVVAFESVNVSGP